MDVGNSLLAQMLIETMTPVIMVLPTPLVEAACQKNNLDFVQMLRPFCFYDKIDVPVRTASDQPYRLQKFKLRMFYASEIRQPRVEIKEFMQDLSVKNVIPYLEQKIRSLNQQVSATRKGLKNQIKNLWWRKGKDDTSDVSNGPMYTFSSIESQIRVLGDYAFMLRDYELALSNYRLLSTDYKIDKAWKRYAGVQEMIGLSLFMLDQSRKEAEYCMETAFTTYQACLPEKMWQSLEEGLVPSMPSTITNWLESAAKSPSKSEKIKDSNISIAGEAIELELEFKNPLHIPINVSAVSLICDFISEAMAKEFGSEDNVPGEEESGAELYLSHQETRGITGDGWIPSTSLGLEVSHFISDRKISDCGASSLSLSEEAFTLKGGQSMMVRLKVTPGKEGFLHIVGVKWVLSGTVMGRCDFAPQSPKKKRIKGRNKDSAEYPPHQRLKFAVLKNMKLKINHPRFLIAGELEDLDAEFPVCLEAQEKNKIHVRWPNDDNSDMKAVSGNTIFSFPKDVSLEGGSTLLWPLWLHTGEAGTLSLSISIYYETETPSEDMNYRTLRLHFNVQVSSRLPLVFADKIHRSKVLPSLDISVNITPCPSKLQEFLLRLDILNQNISESFWLRQVSSVGMQWKLASLLPSLLENINANEDGTGSNAINTAYLSASVSPSQLLPSGQALSLFFKLVDSTRFTTLEVSGNPVYSKQYNSDVRLGPPSSSEPLIDIASGPLSKFHIEERIVQKTSLVQNSRQCSNDSDSPSTVTQEYGSVDLILIAEQQDEAGNLRLEDLPDAQRISSHHICHCSVKSLCPIWWIMEGPKTVVHDFSSLSFCEIKFCLTIRNCSDVTASIKIETFDNGSVTGQTSDVAHLSAASRNQVGWHDISLETDDTGKPISEPGQGSSIISSNEFPEFHTIVPCSPFMWCSLSSKKITEVGAWSSATVPLSLSVFAPGVFDLSNYRLLWKLHPDENYPQTKREVRSPPTARGDSFHVPRLSSEKDTSTYSAEGTKGPSSGMGLGHPFLLTVLQTT